LFKGNELKFTQGYGSYVMENVLFKISFPAEFHSQTACEAAVTLHPQVVDKFNQIEKIIIETQESGVRIIDKTSPLNNPADRDHCIQYMVAVPLIKGNLTAEDYEDNVAADPLIDELRNNTEVAENTQFTVDYLDASKRSIGNSVQVFFKDGSKTEKVSVEYPIGHRRRRAEGIPVLQAKFARNLVTRLSPKKSAKILEIYAEQATLENTPVNEFTDLFTL
jgi:2-methylcitrate dehydratase